MMTSSKAEDYRLRGNSLLLLDLKSQGSTTEDLLPPSWNLNQLENQSEDFIQRASNRIKKLKISFGEIGLGQYIKRWRNVRKAGLLSAELESLLPKLKSTEEEVRLWRDVLVELKSSTISQGHVLLVKVQNSIKKYEKRLDFYDELNNDCRQVNFDVSQTISELLHSVAFNSVCSLSLAAFIALLR
jgi:hypothetical protein